MGRTIPVAGVFGAVVGYAQMLTQDYTRTPVRHARAYAQSDMARARAPIVLAVPGSGMVVMVVV